ncbi:MAG: ABC transporter substrate-binding protein, partial [Actinomycetota bacterium]|nr:ABC transporter substrate-binding protein [Actinomycetota bacterium]
KSAGKELSSIVVQGNSITFKLKKAVGDFGYTVAEPTTVPIPKAQDNGIQYDSRPFSSGPYKIDVYKRGKSLTLVRNPHWSKATDNVRNAYPDRVVCSFGLDPTTIDQRLIADSAQDQSAIDLDTSLAPESIPQAEANPAVKARTIRGLDGYLRYLAINTSKVKDLKVRQAIEYAVNKETYRTARGGKSAGDYATTIMTPLLPGYNKYDLYKAPPQGDPAKAKQLLQEAGVSLPLKMTLATTNVGKGVTTGVALQSALKRAGIEVNIQQISPDVYYTTIGDTSKMPELAFTSWGPDWPSGSTVIPPLFDGRQIKPQGNNDISMFNDPTLNAEMDRINAITDIKKQAPEWGKLDKKIMEQAPIVPLIYNAGIQLHGSKVRGAYLHAYYGEWDMVSLSVA